MPDRTTSLSTAESRRPLVARAALTAFARSGYHATTVADVASEAGISPAYVFKLFPGKETLFVAAIDECFDEVLAALARGADAANSDEPAAILDAMGAAYAHLISDRRLLIIQVHAQSVAEIPAIGEALREGLKRVTTFAKRRSAGTDEQVQRFIAYGQLCHLIVATGIDASAEAWAAILNRGIRHP